ncbi:hypothetical protein [Thomasclavelia cocleata]|uniref:hypothetical protein n=1 Tax=Thomasclavelia cocleata TaxID=69824 RepID=UPI00241C733E|nr:hypothetical protein [Thomasclavelia cocleata]
MEKKYTTFKDKQDAQEFIIGIIKKMNSNDQKDAALIMAGFALRREADSASKPN